MAKLHGHRGSFGNGQKYGIEDVLMLGVRRAWRFSDGLEEIVLVHWGDLTAEEHRGRHMSASMASRYLHGGAISASEVRMRFVLIDICRSMGGSSSYDRATTAQLAQDVSRLLARGQLVALRIERVRPMPPLRRETKPNPETLPANSTETDIWIELEVIDDQGRPCKGVEAQALCAGTVVDNAVVAASSVIRFANLRSAEPLDVELSDRGRGKS